MLNKNPNSELICQMNKKHRQVDLCVKYGKNLKIVKALANGFVCQTM